MISLERKSNKCLSEFDNKWMLLLCKDKPLLKFIVRNAQVVQAEIFPENKYLLPNNIFPENPAIGLQAWLLNRHLDFSRTAGRRLLLVLDLIKSKSINNVLHNNSLTLVDCYWTKLAEDEREFADVSLYRKKENTLIVDVSLSNVETIERIQFAPNAEITNIGSFNKAWRNIDNEWRLYKQGSKYNYYAELFYYNLATELGLDVAKYAYDVKFKQIYTVNFTSEDVMLEHEFSVGHLVSDVQKHNLFESMHFLDAVTCNYDRHEYNYGYLKCSQTGDILKPAPIFDNNLSMGVDGDGGNMGYLSTTMLKCYIQDYRKIPIKITEEQLLRIHYKTLVDLKYEVEDFMRQEMYLKDVASLLKDIKVGVFLKTRFFERESLLDVDQG